MPESTALSVRRTFHSYFTPPALLGFSCSILLHCLLCFNPGTNLHGGNTAERRNVRLPEFNERKHFNESDLEKADSRCPLCGHTARRRVGVLQHEPTVDLLECENCRAVSASRMPTMRVLKNHYSDYDGTYERYSSDHHVTYAVPAKLVRHLSGMMLPRLTHPSGTFAVLDFGGGDGTIARGVARRLLAAGFDHTDITIIDYNNAPVEQAERTTIRHHANLNDVHNTGYDLVIASAIIEHVPDAGRDLARLWELLAPGGFFYARTPFLLPLATVLAPLNIRMNFGYPGHLHDLGCRFWDNHLERLCLRDAREVLASRPSIVESSLGRSFWLTLVSHMLKFPWRVVGNRYTLVGGWEVCVRKQTAVLNDGKDEP